MSLTPQGKNSVTMTAMIRAGQGWQYDQPGFLYDGPNDSEGRTIYYDGVGSEAVMTPLSKNSASLTGLTKNAA